MVAMKETEPRKGAVDSQVLKEVDEYIEKIEKQTEKTVGDALKPSLGQAKIDPVYDDMGKAVMQTVQGQGKKKIVLPLDEEEVREGLHRKIFDAFRWAAEWCVMIIKKYPGRVFYRAGGEKND